MNGFLELSYLFFMIGGISYYLYCVHLGKQEVQRAEQHARELKRINTLILEWHVDQLNKKPNQATAQAPSLDTKGAHNG